MMSQILYIFYLTPTLLQIADQFQIIGKPMNLRLAVVVGGMGMMDQGIELSQRPHIVIATPGRYTNFLIYLAL